LTRRRGERRTYTICVASSGEASGLQRNRHHPGLTSTRVDQHCKQTMFANLAYSALRACCGLCNQCMALANAAAVLPLAGRTQVPEHGGGSRHAKATGAYGKQVFLPCYCQQGCSTHTVNLHWYKIASSLACLSPRQPARPPACLRVCQSVALCSSIDRHTAQPSSDVTACLPMLLAACTAGTRRTRPRAASCLLLCNLLGLHQCICCCHTRGGWKGGRVGGRVPL
jgi:hypothetical protein